MKLVLCLFFVLLLSSCIFCHYGRFLSAGFLFTSLDFGVCLLDLGFVNQVFLDFGDCNDDVSLVGFSYMKVKIENSE